MRKSVLTLLAILVFSSVVYADNPVPNMRPASPDVPSEVKSDEGDYMPGVYKQHEDVKVDEVDAAKPKMPTEEEAQQAGTQDEEESDDPEDDSENLEDSLEGESNPINNDATDENVKNENFVPVQDVVDKGEKKLNKTKDKVINKTDKAVDTVDNAVDNAVEKSGKKAKKAKNKKKKKERPKYGRYKDADSDPYIQKWEEELKGYDPKTGLPLTNFDEDGNPVDVNAKEEQKTYSQDDYEQAYRDMEVPTFSFVHGVDPDQYYDMKDSTWSPYPLLRLNSPLYFKTIAIEPGYYLLTPRKYKESWYILFKEAGVVKYTIPVFDKSFTPEFYYRDTLKELDMTRSARWQVKFLNAWGKYIRKSKRKPAIKCNIELTDLDNNFLLLELYYGAHKYSTIFRTEKY